MLSKIILLYTQKDAENYSHEKQTSNKEETEVQKLIQEMCSGGFKSTLKCLMLALELIKLW